MSGLTSDMITLRATFKSSGWLERRNTQEGIGDLGSELTHVQSTFSSYVEETAEAIYQYVGETHLDKSEFEETVTNINTLIEQTSTSWELSFENTVETIGEQIADLDSDIESASEANKYIRMEDGNIILGQEGSSTYVQISRNRIQFMQGGREVAFISNQEMQINHGIFVESLTVGEHKVEAIAGGHTIWRWVN